MSYPILFAISAALSAAEPAPPAPRRDAAFERVRFSDPELESTADRTDGISPVERPVLERLLKHIGEIEGPARTQGAQRLFEKRQATRADAPRSFSIAEDLAAHPGEYRGLPVKVWGRLRRVERVPAAEGLPEHFTASLEPAWTPQSRAVLLFSTLPEGVAEGDDLDVPVLATGWFFKLGSANDANETKNAEIPWLATNDLTPLGDTLTESILANSRPRSFMIEPDERDAYLQAIAQARLVGARRLAEASREFLAHRMRDTKSAKTPETYDRFVDAFRNPNEYRGRPVTFSGHVRRLVPVDPGANEYGIDQLYEAWLYTSDSQGNPAIVVCTSIPDGIPTGTDLVPAVEVVTATGYFFKICGYGAREANRVAPMIVAGELSWAPPPPPPPRVFPWWVWGAGAVVLGLILFVVFRGRREEREFESDLRRRTQGDEKPDFDHIPPSEGPRRPRLDLHPGEHDDPHFGGTSATGLPQD